MSVIEIRDLTYTYPSASKQSLRNVDLTVQKGEFTILTGPSGCGKTTLCRCFNGLIPHFYSGELKGSLKVAGLNVNERSTGEMAKHVGLVFQNPENQLFALTVEKDVAFGLENLGMPRDQMQERVAWALKMTGIEDLRDRAPHELSGGQQQRIGIARALARKPDIILLDEPTSALDPELTGEVIDTLRDLAKKGITMLIVSHEMPFAREVAEEMIFFDEGQIVETGPPEQFFTNPTSERAKKFMARLIKRTRRE